MKVRAVCYATLVVCGVLGYERFVSTQTQPTAPYFIADLGTLGGAESRALGLSENADAVGSSLRADGTTHAFLSTGTAIKDLGTLGGASSVATDADRSGEVVGDSLTSDGNQRAFLYTPARGMVSLGTLGGSASAAFGVNNEGTVVGSAQTPGNAARRAFLYRNGAMTTLADTRAMFGGTDSAATAIADYGDDIVGWASTSGNASKRAFWYSAGVMKDLGTLGGASVATGVSYAGEVVGYSEVASAARHAFLYSGGSMLDLGTLGGRNSEATAVNEWSQIVGFSEMAGGGTHAFLYHRGVMTDLNSLLRPGSGWVLEAATAVNGSGEIAGYGRFNGRRHAFRLLPPVDIEVRPTGPLSNMDSNVPRFGVQVGRTLTFVSSVQIERGTARNVVFTDTISGPIEIVGVSTYRETEPCTVEGRTVTCRIPAIGHIAYFEQEFWVTVRVAAPGAFSHVARATADNVRPDVNDTISEDNVGVALSTFTLSAPTVAGGKAVLATATLTSLAPPGGAVVKIASSNPAVAPIPSILVVQLPTNTRNFNIVPPVVSQPTTVTISATYGLVTISRSLTVVPPALAVLSLSRGTIIGSCQTATGKVTLTGSAPSSGATVLLATTTVGAKSPPTVVVPAGATSARFTVTTSAVSARTTGTFTASYGGVSKAFPLSVRPIYLSAVALAPATVVGGGTAIGQATIECAAPPGGTTISLASTNPAVATPATSSIVIAAGATKGAFSVRTKQPPAAANLSIRVTANGVTKSAPLTVTR